MDKRRSQINYLVTWLEHYIGEHSDYDLVRILGSGSVAKGTALKGSSDVDVVAYVKSAAVGGPNANEAGLLSWLRDRLIEVYGATKSPEDFVISDDAVGITFSNGLKVDVAPGDLRGRQAVVRPPRDTARRAGPHLGTAAPHLYPLIGRRSTAKLTLN